jgi:hypothetical protein
MRRALRRRGIALRRLAVLRGVMLARWCLTIVLRRWLLRLWRIPGMMGRGCTVWSRWLRGRRAVVSLLLLRRLAVALWGRIMTLRRRSTMRGTLRSTVLLLRVRRLLVALLIALRRCALRRCALRITVRRLLFFSQKAR